MQKIIANKKSARLQSTWKESFTLFHFTVCILFFIFVGKEQNEAIIYSYLILGSEFKKDQTTAFQLNYIFVPFPDLWPYSVQQGAS